MKNENLNLTNEVSIEVSRANRWAWPATAILTIVMATLASGCGILAESQTAGRDPQFSCEGRVDFTDNTTLQGVPVHSSLDSILNGTQLEMVQSEVFVRTEDLSSTSNGAYAEALVVDNGPELKSTCRAQLNEKTGSLEARFPSKIEKTQTGQIRLTEVQLETTFLKGQLKSELRLLGFRSSTEVDSASAIFPGWTVRKIVRSEISPSTLSAKWVFVLDKVSFMGSDRNSLSIRVTYQQRGVRVPLATNCADLTGNYSNGAENFFVYQTGCQELQFHSDVYELNEDFTETVRTGGDLNERVSTHGTRYLSMAYWDPTPVSNKLTILRASEFERGIGSSTTEVLSLEYENCQGVSTRDRVLKRVLYRAGKKTNCTSYVYR